MAENLTIRQMPYSLEAEQAILGAAIADAEKLNSIPYLKASDFYLSQHQSIYTILMQMYQFNKHIDMVTLLDELSKLEELKGTDLVKYVKLLVESAAFSPNIAEHAAIVRDKAVLRKLIDVSQNIADDAYSGTEDVDTIVGSAEQRIYDISNNKYNEGFAHISQAIKENFDLLDKRMRDPEGFQSGVKSHYQDLDNLIRFGPGDLIIVGGRPGMGKTTFAMNIAANVAKTPMKDGSMPEVVVFSLEMTNQQLAERLLSAEGGVDSNVLIRGKLEPEHWKKLADAAARLSQTQLLIDETSNIAVTEMKAKLRRLKNLGLVVIDYLQLMHSDRHTDNRVLEIADITRGLKLLAKDLGVPVILCSQLKREAGTGKAVDKMPQLSDLRDSGAIEQDADVVIFLHRDDYGQYENDKDGIATAKAIVAKNRHGSTGTVNLSWCGANFKFFAIETRYDS